MNLLARNFKDNELHLLYYNYRECSKYFKPVELTTWSFISNTTHTLTWDELISALPKDNKQSVIPFIDNIGYSGFDVNVMESIESVIEVMIAMNSSYYQSLELLKKDPNDPTILYYNVPYMEYMLEIMKGFTTQENRRIIEEFDWNTISPILNKWKNPDYINDYRVAQECTLSRVLYYHICKSLKDLSLQIPVDSTFIDNHIKDIEQNPTIKTSEYDFSEKETRSINIYSHLLSDNLNGRNGDKQFKDIFNTSMKVLKFLKTSIITSYSSNHHPFGVLLFNILHKLATLLKNKRYNMERTKMVDCINLEFYTPIIDQLRHASNEIQYIYMHYFKDSITKDRDIMINGLFSTLSVPKDSFIIIDNLKKLKKYINTPLKINNIYWRSLENYANDFNIINNTGSCRGSCVVLINDKTRLIDGILLIINHSVFDKRTSKPIYKFEQRIFEFENKHISGLGRPLKDEVNEIDVIIPEPIPSSHYISKFRDRENLWKYYAWILDCFKKGLNVWDNNVYKMITSTLNIDNMEEYIQNYIRHKISF